MPSENLQHEPEKEQLFYFDRAEEVMNKITELTRYHQNQSAKLSSDQRSYVLHISTISAAIIGAWASFGRDLFQSNCHSKISLFFLAFSLFGGIGYVIWRTEKSMQDIQAQFNSLISWLRTLLENLQAGAAGKKSFYEIFNNNETLKKESENKIVIIAIKKDLIVWSLYISFLLGVVFLLIALLNA